MAILQGEDGYLTFSIPTDKNNPDISLPKMSEYVNLLNDNDLANSLVNRHGLITTTEVQGVFVETSPNKFGIVLGPEFNPIIYRGQNNDYPFMPSSKRYELADGNERVRHSIDWIKRNEFIKLLSNTSYCTRTQRFKVLDCNYDVNCEAFANLYNYVTDYIDVTRNMMVAYFFAYTYFDEKTARILPVKDFGKYSPTLYVANLRELYSTVPESINRIGLQPSIRAKVQQTMSINVQDNKDLVKGLFKKIDLPKNSLIAKNVFNQFNGGSLIFPSDYASRCALQIRGHRTLQEEFIDKYCDETSTDKNWLRGELKKLGFELINQPWDIPEQARYMINREIDEFIIPYLNSSFIYRGVKRES